MVFLIISSEHLHSTMSQVFFLLTFLPSNPTTCAVKCWQEKYSICMDCLRTHTCAIMYALVCTHPIFQTYFPAFEACVREGRGASIMCSYNAVNGVPSCANDLFQNQVVRDQWGFQGFIVSSSSTLRLTIWDTALAAHIRNNQASCCAMYYI